MKRYHITVGAKTTAGGTVRTGWAYSTIDGQAIAREGDEVDCPQCASTGLIVCDGPHLVDLMDGRNAALDGDLCQCQCDPPPRLIANQTLRSQLFEDRTLTPRGPATGQPLNNHLNRPASTTPGTHGVAPSMPFGERPELGCENLWRGYQQRAEAIVAPGGRLIADPQARNRPINSAYARLWLDDRRFQWAGLAAFASKQVGCGLLHATDSIEKIQAQHEAGQDLLDSAERRWQLPGLTLFGKTDQQAQHHYEQNRYRWCSSNCSWCMTCWHWVIPRCFWMCIRCMCFTRSKGCWRSVLAWTHVKKFMVMISIQSCGRSSRRG